MSSLGGPPRRDSSGFAAAVAAFHNGNAVEAERMCRELLASQPDHADAWTMLGLIAQADGRKPLAVEAFGRVTALRPGDAAAWCNLGESRRRLGDLEAAVQALQRAVELNPNLAEARFNLATTLRALGPSRFEQAASQFEAAIQLRPRFPKALYNFANLRFEQGLLQAAIDLHQRALTFQPQWVDCLVNLAAALEKRDAWDEAETVWRDVLKLDPARLESRESLALLLARRGDVAAGIAELDRAVNHPSPVPAAGADRRATLNHWLRRLRRDCLIEPVIPDDSYVEEVRARLFETLHAIGPCPALPQGEERDRIGLVEPPMSLVYHAQDDRLLWERFHAAYESALPDEGPPPPRRQGKPRLGVVVTHGHEGVFAQCAGPLAARLANDELEVAIACVWGARFWLRHRLGDAAESLDWITLPTATHVAAQTLRAAGCDALWYWESGTDSVNHFVPYLRPSPLQFNGWGWPMTCGHQRINGFLTSHGLDPALGADAGAEFTEPLARLASPPTYFLRSAFDQQVTPRPGEFGIEPGDRLIACIQRTLKLRPEFDRLAARILEGVPNARLMLTADAHPRICNALKSRLRGSLGRAFDRVIFTSDLDRPRYLGMVSRADLSLDPPGYGGGANTVYDAMGVGTPIVTQSGRFHRGRWAAMTLRRLELTDCIGDDPAEIAIRLLTDHEQARDVRARIAAGAPMLFEDEAVVREHRDFFLEAIARSRS